jgi:23S rRNA (cytosine1962-C5)-methyltransferase
MASARMSLAHLWPSFPPERILYEDDDLVVIDKPVDVSTHAPDAGRSDDAVSRLGRAIAERDRVPADRVYLGIHQRLDRDTSGALLFTRRKSANAAIAAQFEGRRVRKTYVAGVVGWPKKMQEGTLTNFVEPADAGRMRVVEAPTKKRGSKAQKAITSYRVLERQGDRALLELSPQTGRTHQLRVQIAANGAAIAGDRMYGGAPAPRLMLHAARLELSHPTGGEPLVVRAPVPAALETWLDDPHRDPLRDASLFEARLAEAVGARFALGRSDDTTAFRLLHGAGDGVLGVAIDVYGEHLLVHFFSDEARAQKDAILDRAFSLGVRGVYLMIHPKQSNTLVDPRKESLAPAQAVRGESAADPLVIRELALAYRVRLGDGLKTGIFLDQRENRRRVRELSAGKRVLNLFAYTCAFTVAAAAGGARQTVSVDASRGALAWGQENLRENRLDSPAHALVDADVFQWLKLAAKRGDRYDLVILDPPSYATTKTSRFSAADDYAELAASALALVAAGGRLLACTNHRGISVRKFRKRMHDAGRLAGRAMLQVKDLLPPGDFPFPIDGEPDLKSLLVTVK